MCVIATAVSCGCCCMRVIAAVVACVLMLLLLHACHCCCCCMRVIVAAVACVLLLLLLHAWYCCCCCMRVIAAAVACVLLLLLLLHACYCCCCCCMRVIAAVACVLFCYKTILQFSIDSHSHRYWFTCTFLQYTQFSDRGSHLCKAGRHLRQQHQDTWPLAQWHLPNLYPYGTLWASKFLKNTCITTWHLDVCIPDHYPPICTIITYM